MRDGFIKPTPFDPAELAKGEKPVTWFSSNDYWETTAAKAVLNEDTGERHLMTIEEQSKRIGVCRFKFAADDIPNLMDWETIKQRANIPPTVAAHMTNVMDAKPHEWFGTLDPVRIQPSICSIELYDHNTDSWVTNDILSTRQGL